jgi:hypothetical protein
MRDAAGHHRRHCSSRQSYDEKSRPAHVRSLLHCAAGRQRLYGAPPATNLSKKTPAPNSEKEPERATAPYDLDARRVNSQGRRVHAKISPRTAPMEGNVSDHKYKIGQLVNYLGRERASGVYQITQLLPPEGQAFQYRIKNANEPRERMAKEHELFSAA